MLQRKKTLLTAARVATALMAVVAVGCGDASRYGAGADGGGRDGGTGGDAGADVDGATGACQPNGDGVIERGELVLGPGVGATVRDATDTPVDTAGTEDGGGQRQWDLSGQLSGDHDVQVELQPLTGQWFANDFPTGQYTAALSPGQDLLGVFRVDDDAVRLLGVVSRQDGATATELSYDPAVVALALPLSAGTSWDTDSNVSGQASGVAALYREIYHSTVDASGTLATPYGDFPVLRVAVDLQRWVGTVLVTTRTFTFVTECYGMVAQVRSRDDESKDQFDQAAEVWRLAP